MSAKLTDQCFEAAHSIWSAQVDHPFVQGIADGSLEVDTFKNWVRQDYLYLKEFSRVFAWATAKADKLESMQWYATVLDMTLNTEMDLHRSYASEFGIDEKQLEAEQKWPTTQAYTDFLVRTAADGDMVDLLAGLLPCAWGYNWVANQLVDSEMSPDDERYQQWIDTYTSEDFEQAADWLKAELNRLADGQTDEKKSKLVETFVVSSKYELRFWEMCWTSEGWEID